nr:ABC transporter permease [Lancefieldella parvula]
MAVSARDAWYPTHQRDQFILRQLVSKDFKLKYRRSILGVVWSVLNPLLMMAVMAVVFSTFLGNRAEDVVNYPLYLILGNTAFQLMNDATTMGMRSIIDASSLLKKVRINRVVFPVQKVLFAVVNYLFSLIAVGIVMLVFRIPLTIYALLTPVALLLLTGFCIGLAMLLSALAVFFRDVIHLWSVVTTAWMYGTPLFYSVNIMSPWMLQIERFNPMFHFVTFIRDCLLFQKFPATSTILGCLVSAVLALVIGYTVFHKLEKKFILHI